MHDATQLCRRAVHHTSRVLQCRRAVCQLHLACVLSLPSGIQANGQMPMNSMFSVVYASLQAGHTSDSSCADSVVSHAQLGWAARYFALSVPDLPGVCLSTRVQKARTCT